MTAKRTKRIVKPDASKEKYGNVIGPGEVRFERVLPGPLKRVWSYITEPEKRKKWFAAGSIELKPGGKIEFLFYNSKLSKDNEPIPKKYQKHEGEKSTGEVIRCEPPRTLSFLWNHQEGGVTEVTFELSPRGEKVLLVVTHRQLGTRSDMINVSGGWHIHLAILAEILNGEEPRPFWTNFAALEKDYERRIPKDVPLK